jgi:hypothetical protein
MRGLLYGVLLSVALAAGPALAQPGDGPGRSRSFEARSDRIGETSRAEWRARHLNGNVGGGRFVDRSRTAAPGIVHSPVAPHVSGVAGDGMRTGWRSGRREAWRESHGPAGVADLRRHPARDHPRGAATDWRRDGDWRNRDWRDRDWRRERDWRDRNWRDHDGRRDNDRWERERLRDRRDWRDRRPLGVRVYPRASYYGIQPSWSDYGRRWDHGFGFGYGWGVARAPYWSGWDGDGWDRATDWLRRDPSLRQWVMLNFDRDRNGFLDRWEAQLANQAFERVADRNGNGRISTGEYREALASLRYDRTF